jgi:hypothetical protein
MKHDTSGTDRRIGSKTIAVLSVLAIVAVGLAAAAAFTPTATINDDSELNSATTTTNVSVTGSGDDAVIEHSDGSHTGTYESQNVTVEHSTDREEIQAELEDVTGANVTVTALRFNSTSSAWETTDETKTESNGTVALDITGNDTVKYRLKATFEASTTANLTEWSIGGTDSNDFTYTEKTDDETAFGSATLEDGAALKTGSDSVDETARIKFDSSNYSTYTGPSYVVSDSADREGVAVELSNVSTDVEIAAEYKNADGNWTEAVNETVSAAGTHALNISEWDQNKWRLVVQNEPGGHAALTREGIGSGSDFIGGGGGGSSSSGEGVLIGAAVLAVLGIAAYRMEN